MKKTKVVAIGSGAYNVASSKKNTNRYEVLSIDKKDGCGNNAEIGKNAAKEFFESLDKFVADSDNETIFLISTLGGGMGTGATPVIAEHLTAMGKQLMSVVTLPFGFEGKAKLKRSLKTVNELSKNCNITIAINQEQVRRNLKKNTPINKFFKIIDEEVFRVINTHIKEQ